MHSDQQCADVNTVYYCKDGSLSSVDLELFIIFVAGEIMNLILLINISNFCDGFAGAVINCYSVDDGINQWTI